ncbi:sensory neuron membrane protein 1-like [Diabrotica virgifera virgifera]|uniref:Sensory neuron membrane protein 2 n=1 Tax=Diabrotica virgifera virgifera TaxID=50390 RepID=A0ABM5L6B9_DIAVI|nr:sensory neuron membrane protein 1-like [Diabrotica virgifera virgifera]
MVNAISFNVSNRILIILGVVGGILVFGAVFLGFKIIPDAVTTKLWETKVLKENTQQWDIFVKTPFPFIFKVYVYDVQNPDEILQGAKPVVKEVGPFVYKVYKWKGEIEWATPDEIAYNAYTRFEFDKEASGIYSDDTVVTILNSMYYSVLLKIEDTQPEAMGIVEPALPSIFGENDGMFTKVKVKDYLFEGLKFCEDEGKSGGFAAVMFCKQVIGKLSESKNLRLENKTVLFANLYYKNNTHLGRFTVKSGQKSREEAGILTLYNEKEYISTWAGGKSTCNKIGGVTTVFPANIKPDMEFVSYAEDICRSVALTYDSDEVVKGLKGLKFVAKNDTFSSTKKENLCFCLNKTKTFDGNQTECAKDGITDLTSCTGGPVMVSFPHLLYGDKEYQETVIGMEANTMKHQSFIILEELSGLPLYAAQRIQFNMFLRPVEGMESLANMSKALMPLIWVEESLIIEDKYISLLQESLFKTLSTVNILKWFVIVIGVACLLISALTLIYRQAP